MQIIINNIKWNDREFDHVYRVRNILINRLRGCRIQVNCDKINDTILFKEIERGKLAKSRQYNAIQLKEGDARIAKLGRNFLESTRLTKEQYIKFQELLHEPFDKLGLSCDITYINNDERSAIRVGKLKYNGLPTPKSFPIDKERIV